MRPRARLRPPAQAHFANFRRRATAEVDDRKTQHEKWERSFAADTAAMAASHARLGAALPPETSALAAATEREAEARRGADALFLRAMGEAMSRLRAEAILNFGGGAEEEGEGGGEGEGEGEGEGKDGGEGAGEAKR